MKQVLLTVDDVRNRFKEIFNGAQGNVYAAPGRINLIGEHTDYNGGYVFPGAVDKGMVGNYDIVGRLMYETHKGLSQEYKVSCPELDFLNDIARNCGVTGSRMMVIGDGARKLNCA